LKRYTTAPLKFIGQKRNWRSKFERINFSGSVVVDVFGGSGLISHAIKASSPRARVIWNDFDNYASRLSKIVATEALRADLYEALKPTKPIQDANITDEQKAIIYAVTAWHTGYDEYTAQSWFNHQLLCLRKGDASIPRYYRLRSTPYPECSDYLKGVEREQMDFREIISKYKGLPNVVFICDPPYIFTVQSTYSKKGMDGSEHDFHSSFGLKDTIEMINMIGDKPAYIFASEKSEIHVLFDLLGVSSYSDITKSINIGTGNPSMLVEKLYYINGAKRSPHIQHSLFDNPERSAAR
jgi:hypothetical protein